jgi:uncharacterized protein YegP (UPF0339 family)
MAKAKFVVRKGRTGLFRFNLVGPNGKVIATSQAYQSRTSALRGIESVRKHAANAELVDMAGTRVVGGRVKKGGGTRAAAMAASDVGVVVRPGVAG